MLCGDTVIVAELSFMPVNFAVESEHKKYLLLLYTGKLMYDGNILQSLQVAFQQIYCTPSNSIFYDTVRGTAQY